MQFQHVHPSWTGMPVCLPEKGGPAVPAPQNWRVNSHAFGADFVARWWATLGFRPLTVKFLYNISIIYIYLGYSFVTLSVMILAG
ncbi:protein of unknown function [Agrobacterium pusense]|uniref:Uncharacterized protein n=1 Tax=Agrobacterium pusense TaxID=648995 RepID=U4PW43_9HYPH|nr:protein of unknown function [Agrobacterium pusense]